MPRFDLGRAMIEGIVSRALKDMQSDSHRTARRLVDLGLSFSKGPFERQFFSACKNILADDESAYYPIWERALRCFDLQSLVTFGINVGYEGCSRGAKRIREVEDQRGFNVPWVISLCAGQKALSQTDIQRAIQEAEALGVHVFLLLDHDLQQTDLTGLLEASPASAFALFIKGERLRELELDGLRQYHNLLVCVDGESAKAEALCAGLTDARMPYAVYLDYDTQEGLLERISRTERLESPLLLLRSFSAPEATRQQVYQWLQEVRGAGELPFTLMELPSDLLAIDQIISSDPSSLTLLPDGRVQTGQRITDCNIQQMCLEQILAHEMQKGQKM